MPSSDLTKKALVATYVIVYASTLLWALVTSDGASGGMAFVLPVILGIPWSLLLGILLLVAPIPRIVMLILLVLVPPAINVYLIFRTRGIFRAPRDLNQIVAKSDSDANNHDA